MCFLTWKDKATPAGRLLFQLAPSTPRTDGIGSGLWPTATTQDNVQIRGVGKTVGTKRGTTLGGAVRMWPTPTAQDNRDRGGPSSPSIQRRAAIGKSIELSMCVDGSLNPTWVEWLMGFPKDWLEVE
jgi:DNA (cytosine-5)-methyltransferase 1